ncbi:MAG: hypothetical protein QOD13_3456 [Thermoleophilaceae bacterium]|nr:hypothetical protein [Thermoleophilaceae bacterium]
MTAMRHRARPGLPLCVLAAAASVPLVSALNYDAWGWLLWGRELVGHLPFTTAGYPSWKPLTALVAVPLAPLGSAAPYLWLGLARAGAAVALLLAYRLGRRVAGPWAGALAAATLMLVPGWLLQTGVGGSEPLLTALLLGAVERHAERAHGQGLALALLAALLRPEAWPALLLSGAVAWRRAQLRPFVALAVVAVPALWFGGEYLGSGSPFTGGELARMSKEAHALQQSDNPPPLVVLQRAAQMLSLPLLLGLPLGVAAGWRRRDPVLLALSAGAIVWTAEVATMAALGYAGIPRFLFPATAAGAVVGAAGLVLAIRRARRVPARVALTFLAALALSFEAGGPLSGVGRQARMVEHRADRDQNLAAIVSRVGAAPRGEATALAWRLGITTRALRHRYAGARR